MKFRCLICSAGLAAVLATASGPAAARDLVVRPNLAPVAEAFDAQPVNKVPPVLGAVEAEDGRVRVVVQLADPPLALYEGGVLGLRATRPSATGRRKLDARSAAAVAYRGYLAQRQDRFLAELAQAAPGFSVLHRYDVVFNGIAMAIDREAVEKLTALPGVQRVYPDKLYYASMDASLPLINAQDFWDDLGGRDNAGSGVKVAVVDGGIRPENPMFDGIGFSFPPGYPLANDYCGLVDSSFCNGKLIVARHFRTVALHPSEHDSPLGFSGHGTHVAGTAVGNFVAGVTAADGVPEDISGVAPGAWLMVYKALWWNGTTGSGSTIDLIAAVNAAVADGADVINNSWGGAGGQRPQDDAFGPAFEAANAAGVLSVVAAGNAGPGATTIGCPGCHEVALTVGNTTTNRIHALGCEVVGGPSAGCLEGSGPVLGATVGPVPIVYAGDVGDPLGCTAFPPGAFNGSIALIERGVCNFSVKVTNAAAAGAVFVKVFNNAPGAPIVMGSLGATTVSSCMLSQDDGIGLRDYVQLSPGSQALVHFPASRQTNDSWQDFVTVSSSRGPNGDADVLKPDVAAPGTNILSAHSPEQSGDFAFLTGTSMASPHVAGAAALMLHKHPTWTPEQVKTALTSTSVRGQVKENGLTPADPFDVGAGRLELDRASDAGATFDLPSMAEDQCVVGCSFGRTLRNELGSTTTWTASVETGSPNLGVGVSPSSVTLASGQSASFTVDVDTSQAAQGQWHFAAVVWHPAGGAAPDAYLPIAVFADTSTNADVLTKSVDLATANVGDVVTYSIDLDNGPFSGVIDLTDAVPPNATFVPGSATESVVDGTTISPFAYNPGTNSLSWSGTLQQSGLTLTPSPAPFGYFPLTTPFACPANCDDGGVILTVPAFVYNGTTYTNVIWSVNGTIEPGAASGLATSATNQNLPNATPPNNLLAPLWTDLNLGAGGNWYVAVLNAGATQYTVYEWRNVPLFGDLSRRYTFQVWVQNGTSGNIWFVYQRVDGPLPNLTVGLEDAAGVLGTSRYFNGTGTAPLTGAGGNLKVTTVAGGSASFSFQAQVECTNEAVINVVDVTSGGASESAFALTEVVNPDFDCDGVDDPGDVCPGTVIPESVPTVKLNPNHYALVDDDFVFDTPKAKSEVFTTEDTAGCSCEQIIDALHLGQGHRKHGCSIGVMRNWVDLVNP